MGSVAKKEPLLIGESQNLKRRWFPTRRPLQTRVHLFVRKARRKDAQTRGIEASRGTLPEAISDQDWAGPTSDVIVPRVYRGEDRPAV